MSVTEYIRDHIVMLLLQAAGMAALVLFLMLTGYSRDYCIVILICWWLVLTVWLLVHFFSRRNYFREMERIMDNLDQRYLLGELMPQSFALEDRIYRAMIKKSNQSVIEKIRKLEEVQKEYREFIESWVHEIKTPITGIALHCENHRDESSRYIAGENRRIENYVNMVLYYARSDEVYKDYMIAETNLCEVAEEVLMRNKHALIANHIQASVDCSDMVFTDKKWIAFIIDQLVQNSAKYKSKQGARIRIFTEPVKGGVLLGVEDNGIGVKEEELPRIFEKGFSGTNGRNCHRSTGMGLYLCRKLCQKLGIAICAKSVEGEGTTIMLEFPVSTHFSDFRIGE